MLERIRRARVRIRQLAQAAEDQLAGIREDRELTAEGRLVRYTRVREQAHQEIREALDDARGAAQDLQETAARALTRHRAPSGDSAAQLLAELQESRAWTRVERLLQADHRPEQIVADATERSDGATLRALAAELPSWAAAAGYGDDRTEQMLAAVEDGLVVIMPAGDRQAVQEGREAARLLREVEGTAASTQASLEGRSGLGAAIAARVG